MGRGESYVAVDVIMCKGLSRELSHLLSTCRWPGRKLSSSLALTRLNAATVPVAKCDYLSLVHRRGKPRLTNVAGLATVTGWEMVETLVAGPEPVLSVTTFLRCLLKMAVLKAGSLWGRPGASVNDQTWVPPGKILV